MSHQFHSLLRVAGCAAFMAVGALSPLSAEEGKPGAKDAPAGGPEQAADKGPNKNEEKHVLAFKFKPGQTVRYEVTSKTELHTVFNEASELVRNTSEVRRSYKVADVTPSGEGTLELLIEWTRMEVVSDDGVGANRRVEFQSDDPAKRPPQFRPILAKIGKPQAQIRFDASGRPLEVKPLLDDEKDAADTASSPDASYESYLFPLPEQAMAVNDTWKEQFLVVVRGEENIPVRIIMRREYKLTEVRNGIATIVFRTYILNPINDPKILTQLIQRETTGKIVFDIEQGLLVSRESNVDKTVLAPFGQKSSQRAASTYRERLLPTPTVAGNDAPQPATKKQ